MPPIDYPTPSSNTRRRRRPSPAPTPSINAVLGSSGQPSSPSYPSSPSAILHPAAKPYTAYSSSPASPSSRSRDRRQPAQQQRGRGAVLARVLQGLTAPSIDDPSLTPAVRHQALAAVKASAETGIPASVLLAVNGQETAYSTNRNTSSAGARGAGQFIPSTGATYKAKGYHPFNYGKKGLVATGAYLKDLMAGNGGDLNAALSSYSGGYAESAYNNPILARARSFRQQGLDKVAAGGKVRAPNRLSTSELFYDPGVSLKDNQPTASIGGHSDHVHYASTNPRDLLTAVRVAQRKGATVSENPLFDPVDPVHTGGSYHYRKERLPRRLVPLAQKLGGEGRTIGQAVDIQGSPDVLSAVDKALARRSGAPISASDSYTTSYGGSGGYLGGSGSVSGSGAPLTTGGSTSSRGRSTGSKSFSPLASLGLTGAVGDLLTPGGHTAGDLLAQLEELGGRQRARRRLVTR